MPEQRCSHICHSTCRRMEPWYRSDKHVSPYLGPWSSNGKKQAFISYQPNLACILLIGVYGVGRNGNERCRVGIYLPYPIPSMHALAPAPCHSYLLFPRAYHPLLSVTHISSIRLYHHNPWSDTSVVLNPLPHHLYDANARRSSPVGGATAAASFACPSFAAFLASPVPFFLQRFPGKCDISAPEGGELALKKSAQNLTHRHPYYVRHDPSRGRILSQ